MRVFKQALFIHAKKNNFTVGKFIVLNALGLSKINQVPKKNIEITVF